MLPALTPRVAVICILLGLASGMVSQVTFGVFPARVDASHGTVVTTTVTVSGDDVEDNVNEEVTDGYIPGDPPARTWVQPQITQSPEKVEKTSTVPVTKKHTKSTVHHTSTSKDKTTTTTATTVTVPSDTSTIIIPTTSSSSQEASSNVTE